MTETACFPATSLIAETSWRTATVREVHRPTDRLVMLRLDVPDRLPQLAGQHYIVRLTAPDGYTASRSYSIASAPQDELVELCVERLDDGEVSGYLYDEVQPGDPLEVRGPIGGWFVWDGSCRAVAVGGGTGVAPLVAMLRFAQASGRGELLHLAVSARTADRLPYLDEFRAAGATVALTAPPGSRLSMDQLTPLAAGTELGFVCGSARFAEAVSVQLAGSGLGVERIRVERFGPTG